MDPLAAVPAVHTQGEAATRRRPEGTILHRHSRVLTPTRSAPGTDTGGKRRRFRGVGDQKRARRRAGRGRVRLARVPRVPGGHRSPVHQGQVLLTGQAKATCVRGRRPSSTKFRPRRRERRVRRRDRRRVQERDTIDAPDQRAHASHRGVPRAARGRLGAVRGGGHD